jgi:hypothetical protein
MYMNYLDYFKLLTRVLSEDAGKYPLVWGLSTPPDWPQHVVDGCQTLEAEFSRAYEEAKAVRAMV